MPESESLSIAIVVWDDAFDGPGGWVDPSRYEPHVVCPATIGWIIDNDNSSYLTMYSSFYYDEDGDLMCSNPMHIPRGMIKELTILGNDD